MCAFNDEVALAVLFGIHEAGLRCPDDIAVIGCDIPASAVAYPPLTTLNSDMARVKEVFLWAIMAALGVESGEPPMVELSARLIQRAST